MSTVEGRDLNQAGMRWKRYVHVAGMRGSAGEGNALVAEGHSGMRANKQKLSGSSGLVTGWRPQVAGGQEEEAVRKPTWTWREKNLPQAPRRACGLSQELLCTPHQGGLDVSSDESCPFARASPGSCRRQGHRLQPGADGAGRAGRV